MGWNITSVKIIVTDSGLIGPDGCYFAVAINLAD